MVHRIIATFAVNLVWNTCVARNFSTWLCLAGCWMYERLVTMSRHWYLMSSSLSHYWPSRANSALSFYFWKYRILAAVIFATISIIFAANPTILNFGFSEPSAKMLGIILYTFLYSQKKKKTDICKRLERWRRLHCLSDYLFFRSNHNLILVLIRF